MDIVQTDQLVIVGLFLGLLVAALIFVQANRGRLSGHFGKGRRMQVTEVSALGPDARAMLLNVDGQEYLILTAKRQPPVITPLPQGAAQRPELAQVAA